MDDREPLKKHIMEALKEGATYVPQIEGLLVHGAIDRIAKIVEIYTLNAQIRLLGSLKKIPNYSLDTNGRFRAYIMDMRIEFLKQLEELENGTESNT